MEPLAVEPRLRVVEPAAADWEAVYREHAVPVYRFVFARVGNRPDAEDVTAQTFLRALPRLRLAASPGEIRAYLLTTARSVLADHWTLRFGAPWEELDEERLLVPTAAGGGGGEGEPEGRQAHRVNAILERLPASYRRVLELRFLRGLSVRETAGEMGVSLANAKVLQHRALRRAADLEPAEAPS